jgi:NADPH-dependent curcumin reductase CurA
MPSFKKVVVIKPSTNFRQATEIIQVNEVPIPAEGNVIVRNHYVGINATDINITKGAYTGSTPLPFGCGLEGAGLVQQIGTKVNNVKVGDAVSYQQFGAFAEYVEVPSENLILLPSLTPVVVPLTVCGISASIALEQIGQMKTNGSETVLVTAAAGGTGQFVVQLVKLAGNHVIGTTSSDEKVAYLKSIGCDRVINYTKENVSQVLEKEYPKGVDIVFETIGGKMFETAVKHIAIKGRIILFGYISGYKEGLKEDQMQVNTLNPILLGRSASVRGFFLSHFKEYIPSHMKKLIQLVFEKKINAGIDPQNFKGLEQIADGIDYMYERKNIGKIVIQLC